MKKHLFAILSAGLITASASAQEISYSTSVGVESKYVFRGTQLGDTTFMGAFDIAIDDFYAGVWTAQPTTDNIPWDSEVDFYAGYGFALNDVTSLDIGATYYYYPTTTDASTFETYVGISWDLEFEPAIYVYYDFDLETFTLEASIGYSWDVADKTTFDVSAALGYFDPSGGSSGYYFMGYAGFGYEFTEYASGSIGLNLSDLEDDKSHAWVGAHITVEF